MIIKFVQVVVLLLCLVTTGCEKDAKLKVKKEVSFEGSYVKLKVSDFDKLSDYANTGNVVYKISGNLSGVKFSRKYTGIGIYDFYLHNNNIILICTDGILRYNPRKDTSDWIFKDENILMIALYKFDQEEGFIYTCGTILPGTGKQLLVVDINTAKASRFDINGFPESINLIENKGAIVEMNNSEIFIKSLGNGEFEFIAEE